MSSRRPTPSTVSGTSAGAMRMVLTAFLAGKVVAHQRQRADDAEDGAAHGGDSATHSEVWKARSTASFSISLRIPAEAEARHREAAELRVVEGQHDDDQDRREHEDVDQHGEDLARAPAQGPVLGCRRSSAKPLEDARQAHVAAVDRGDRSPSSTSSTSDSVAPIGQLSCPMIVSKMMLPNSASRVEPEDLAASRSCPPPARSTAAARP